MSYRTEGLLILEGIEPVRLRPGMYVGSTDSRALEHLLFEVVGNSIDQYLSGEARRVDVDIDEPWVTVSDDGAGLVQLETPPHGAINAFVPVTSRCGTRRGLCAFAAPRGALDPQRSGMGGSLRGRSRDHAGARHRAD